MSAPTVPGAATDADLVTLTIDGEQVSVPKGTLIIRAAEMVVTIVPRFCDHPLDCPMCDKGGECPLQDQALAHGANTSRFLDQKRKYEKPVAVSPQVLLDRERCVLCARCTRFSEQISGDPFIELFERGALEQVAIYEDEPYHSYFSGNTIQICPVGALTSTSYRFKARSFDVVTTPSVCDGCSAGCGQTVQSRRGEVQRQLARTNMDVNEAWNCDKGRFSFPHLTHAQRLTTPMERVDGELVPTTWSRALARVADAVRASQDVGPGRTALVSGGRLADEDAHVAARLARTVLGTDLVEHRTRFAPADEAPARAVLLARAGGAPGLTYADVEHAPVIVVAGLDPEEEVPVLHLRLRKAWRQHRARIVVVGPHLGTLDGIAWRRVATAPGAEAAALAALADGDGEIAAALRGDGAPAVLVGERAGAGSLAAGTRLAEAVGGGVAFVPRRAGDAGGLAAGLAPGLLPGGRMLADAADRAEVEAAWGPLPAHLTGAAPVDGLRGILAAAADGAVDVLLLAGADLARDAQSAALAERALTRVAGAGTVVVQDLALTETAARYADVVLPVTATQERDGTRTDWEGRAQRFRRAVDAPELAQDDWEAFVQLAAALGHRLYGSLDAIRAEQEQLGARAAAHPLPDAASAGSTGAPSGDALLAVVRPLLLDGGTMLAGADDLRATARAATVGVSRADAARLGIVDGADVTVTGAGGATVTLPAAVLPDLVPGAVVLPRTSTEPPVTRLADEDGVVAVTLAPVAVPAEVGA